MYPGPPNFSRAELEQQHADFVRAAQRVYSAAKSVGSFLAPHATSAAIDLAADTFARPIADAISPGLGSWAANAASIGVRKTLNSAANSVRIRGFPRSSSSANRPYVTPSGKPSYFAPSGSRYSRNYRYSMRRSRPLRKGRGRARSSRGSYPPAKRGGSFKPLRSRYAGFSRARVW